MSSGWTLLSPQDGRAYVRARKVPAWTISLLFHVLLLVILGVLLRPAVPKGLPSGDRPGGIVLAEVTAEKTEYVQPEAAPEASSAESAASPDASDAPPEAVAGIEMPEPVATLSAPAGIQIGQADATGVGRPVIGSRTPSDGTGAHAAIRSAPRFSGPAAKLSVFGSGFAEGNSFVFVIDRSKSMGSDGLAVLSQAKEELADALRALDARHKFQVVAYHHERVYLDRAGLLRASTENKERVAGFFDGLAAFGGTNHELAVYAALGMRPDVIFLLTDGGSPGLNQGQIDQAVSTAKRMNTAIHCIQFGFGVAPDETFMRELARRTGGSYRYIQRR